MTSRWLIRRLEKVFFDSQWTRGVLASDLAAHSRRSRSGVAADSQRTRRVLAAFSQRTHGVLAVRSGFAADSQRIRTTVSRISEGRAVLLGPGAPVPLGPLIFDTVVEFASDACKMRFRALGVR